MKNTSELVIIDFPSLNTPLKKARKTTITARMPKSARDLCVTRLEELQQAYDGKLDIALQKRGPVISLCVNARTIADLNDPVRNFANQIRKHTGLDVKVASH